MAARGRTLLGARVGPGTVLAPLSTGLLPHTFSPRCPGRGIPRSSQEAQPTASSFWTHLQSPLPSAQAPKQAMFPEYTGAHQLVSHPSPGCGTPGASSLLIFSTSAEAGPPAQGSQAWEAAPAPCPPTEAILGARQLPTDTDSGPALPRCPNRCYLVSKQRGCCSHFHLLVPSFIHSTICMDLPVRWSRTAGCRGALYVHI